MIGADLSTLGAVAAGGAIGACFRAAIYHAAAWLQHTGSWLDQPRGTWVVNGLGSLLLGWVVAGGLGAHTPLDVTRGVGVGFCGSFTTFSTFAGDCYLLMRERRLRDLVWHVGLNGGIGLAAAALGLHLGSIAA